MKLTTEQYARLEVQVNQLLEGAPWVLGWVEMLPDGNRPLHALTNIDDPGKAEAVTRGIMEAWERGEGP